MENDKGATPESWWNYRVTRTKVHGEYVFEIREVYYTNGQPHSWSRDAIAPYGESHNELAGDLAKMQRAVSEPILDLPGDKPREMSGRGAVLADDEAAEDAFRREQEAGNTKRDRGGYYHDGFIDGYRALAAFLAERGEQSSMAEHSVEYDAPGTGPFYANAYSTLDRADQHGCLDEDVETGDPIVCAECAFPPADSCLCRDPLREVHAGCPLHGHSPESAFPPEATEGGEQ